MSQKWRSTGKGKKVRHFRINGRGLYKTPPRYKKYSDIISLRTPAEARDSAFKLILLYNNADHAKKVRIKRAIVQAANRAGVAKDQPRYSDKERAEFAQIQQIYNQAKDDITPKPNPKRPWETMPIIGTVTVEPFRATPDGEILSPRKKYDIVQIVEKNGIKLYITNISYEPERKNEPLVIGAPFVEKYKPKKKFLPKTTKVLESLFNDQDRLIEHKYPIRGIWEAALTDAGDIYRGLATEYPDGTYIGEKVYLTESNILKHPLNQADFEDFKHYSQKPGVQKQKEKYLKNLAALKEKTEKLEDSPRKQAMMDSLKLMKALAEFYEKSPKDNPTEECKKLTASVDNYFKTRKQGGKRAGQKVKADQFVSVLKQEIANNPGLKGSNYEIVRQNSANKLGISKKVFDEILGYMIKTDKIENVWLFTSGSQAKIHHKNMQMTLPFDSIEEVSDGIKYRKKESTQ